MTTITRPLRQTKSRKRVWWAETRNRSVQKGTVSAFVRWTGVDEQDLNETDGLKLPETILVLPDGSRWTLAVTLRRAFREVSIWKEGLG
ncbi:hypothetical protein RvY_15402-1 [Ramazzottius varieornatus]|uniref:Uncharacterized protein n=1 Tax=Ramazzottius varieornatus TaxID=947166 RepID=A0A1D1W2T7_RAMVA|nr:hypothetical protein RvY_15402-1 [Ramazzottius varieornatus]